MDDCKCCSGTGEHGDGHECYVCDASGDARESQGEVCEGHHGRPDDGPENAKVRYGPGFEHYSRFLETVHHAYNLTRAARFADGYEGVTHAGLALVQAGMVFLAQRTMDETDAPEVQETWEFPGGGLDPGEQPFEAALREFLEETGLTMPIDAVVINGWRSTDGVYQGFVVGLDDDLHDEDFTPTSECQAIGWFTRETLPENLRPEVRDDTPWDLIFGEDDAMPDTDEDLTLAYSLAAPVPVHGVMAPEGAESGDGRGFNPSAMSRRDYTLPFHFQNAQASGHDNSVVVGSVEQMMRKDGMIHWQGSLMPTESADELAGIMVHQGGRFGVSVDGDRGSIDDAKTSSTGVLWFDAVRAAGLTACSIPAFSEAYVAFGEHPDMPDDQVMTASMMASGDLMVFGRGPGWVKAPVATNRIHDYWTKPGEPGYAKIAWGTPGDFARAKALIGKEIAKHSPHALKYLNQTIAQWHHDALGYWPATHAKMERGGAKKASASVLRLWASADGEGSLEISEDLFEEADAAGRIKQVGVREDGAVLYELDADEAESELASLHAASQRLIEKYAAEGWEPVLTSSAHQRALPPIEYFSRHPDTDATVIEEPDENGFRRTYGYAGEWGVCHIGMDGRCVEIPDDDGAGYPSFHLGRTKTDDGYINTGVITYAVGHRDGQRILSETATQAHFDDITHAWASVRVGQDDRGVWFSGVVLPTVPEEDIVLIEAAGQVSGEWKHDVLRTILAVNVPGFPVVRASASWGEDGTMERLVASAFNTGTCEPSEMERFEAARQADAEARFEDAKARFERTL